MKAEVAAIKRQTDEGKRSDQIQPRRMHTYFAIESFNNLIYIARSPGNVGWILAMTSRLQQKRQAKEELSGGLFSVISELLFMWNCLLEKKRKVWERTEEGCMLCNSKGREHAAKWRESTKVEPVMTLCYRCLPLLLVLRSTLMLWL